MAATSTSPDPDSAAILPGADFVDAWSIDIADDGRDATALTEQIFARPPRWVATLMHLRDRLVAPFGLKAAARPGDAPDRVFSPFPTLSSRADEVILGFDDRHLDFRIRVDVAPLGGRRRLTTTTIVRTHNLFGRAYLALVMPFHRRIVPTMLAAAAGGGRSVT